MVLWLWFLLFAASSAAEQGSCKFQPDDTAIVTSSSVLAKFPQLKGKRGVVKGETDDGKIRLQVGANTYKLRPGLLKKVGGYPKSVTVLNNGESFGGVEVQIDRRMDRLALAAHLKKEQQITVSKAATKEETLKLKQKVGVLKKERKIDEAIALVQNFKALKELAQKGLPELGRKPRVFTSKGLRISGTDEINDGATLYLVPQWNQFVWPTVKIGHTVKLDQITSKNGKPVLLETLEDWPRVFHVHNFMSDKEADMLISSAKSITDPTMRLKRSGTGADSRDNQDAVRTSSNRPLPGGSSSGRSHCYLWSTTSC
jgi:hypothetical protein